MRVFLAFEMPPGVVDYVTGLQETLRRAGVRGKWTCPDQAHLTLLFLGEQAPAVVSGLAAALGPRLAAVPPVDLEPGCLGTFGRTPRVLYLGYRGPGVAQFAALSGEVRALLPAANIEVPASVLAQEASPHLTVARFRGPDEARTLARVWRGGDPEKGPAQVPLARGAGSLRLDAVVLFESTLGRGGPEHRAVARLPLGVAQA